MQTLEDLQRRIGTTEDLRSIVRTMKGLAAVSIHQFERAAASVAEYERILDLGLQALLMQPDAPRLRRGVATGARAMVVFGSDHGLCGRFNDQVVAIAVRRLVNGEPACLVLAVGLRAAGRLEAMGHRVDTTLMLPGAVGGLANTVQAMLLTLDRWRAERNVTHVMLCHNRRTPHGAASSGTSQLLPLDVERLSRLAKQGWPTRALPMVTIEPSILLSALLRQSLFVSLFRACAELLVSEHATRLASMQAAERNIADHLEEMQGEFRQRRQQMITEELLDVVAGFECLRTRTRA